MDLWGLSPAIDVHFTPGVPEYTGRCTVLSRCAEKRTYTSGNNGKEKAKEMLFIRGLHHILLVFVVD